MTSSDWNNCPDHSREHHVFLHESVDRLYLARQEAERQLQRWMDKFVRVKAENELLRRAFDALMVSADVAPLLQEISDLHTGRRPKTESEP